MNVHEFDGKIPLENRKSLIKGRISVDDKIELFNWLFTKVGNSAKSYLKMIAENIQGSANYETGNDMYADDILGEICLYMRNTKTDPEGSILKTLDEQLSEISGGTCPSGRVTRLWQIYVSIRDEASGREMSEGKEEKKGETSEKKEETSEASMKVMFVNSRGEKIDIGSMFGC